MRKLRYHLLLSFLRAVAFLPFPLLYALGDCVYFVLKYVLRYRSGVILGNLRRSFPEKDDKEIATIADRFYHHLADLIVETIKLLHISDRQLRCRIEVRDGDVVEWNAADGRPVVLFLGHYGNWEWAQEVTRHYRRPDFTCELYRPIHDPAVDAVMNRIRSRFNTTLIPQKSALRQLLGMTRDGRQYLVGFIADQRPYHMGRQHHWMTFLGQPTAVVTGGETIGRHVDAHFMFLEVQKPRRGHYVMTFRDMPVPADAQETYPVTRLYMRMMEAQIRQAPELWLWSHNRWKYDREGNLLKHDDVSAHQ